MRSRLGSFLLVFFLSFVVLSGCKSRMQTASERLRDAVVGYNDELRFGRQDLAVQRVASEHRSEFIGGHYRWGRGIEVADVEVVNVEIMGEDGDRAVSFVNLRWITTGTMLVRESLLRQEWMKHGSWYFLTSERVIDGDVSLLEAPEGFRAETSGLLVDEPDAGVPDGATPPTP